MPKYYYTALELGKKFKFLPGKCRGNRFSAGIKHGSPTFILSEERGRKKNLVEAKNEDFVINDKFIDRLLYSDGLQLEDHAGMHLAFVLNQDNKYEAVGIPFAMAANPWIEDIPYMYMLGDITAKELLLLNTAKCNLYLKRTFEENLEANSTTYFFERQYIAEDGEVSDVPFKGENRCYSSREKKKEFWEAIVPPEIMRKPIEELFLYNAVDTSVSLYHYMQKANLTLSESQMRQIEIDMWYRLEHMYWICEEYHKKMFPNLKAAVINLKNTKGEYADIIRQKANSIIHLYHTGESVDYFHRANGNLVEDLAKSFIIK